MKISTCPSLDSYFIKLTGSIKKMSIKSLQFLQENAYVEVPFGTWLNRKDSNTDISLRILQNFLITLILNNICVLLIPIIIIKNKFLGKPFGHNDHYMINTGGQRPKIDSNWPLTSLYLQYCQLQLPKQ